MNIAFQPFRMLFRSFQNWHTHRLGVDFISDTNIHPRYPYALFDISFHNYDFCLSIDCKDIGITLYVQL